MRFFCQKGIGDEGQGGTRSLRRVVSLMAVNSDMAHNGRYPLVVVAYDIRFHQQQ